MTLVTRLIKIWPWLHGLAIMSILLGHYSRTALGILAALLVLTPLLWKGTRWLDAAISSQYLRLSASQAGVLLVCCALGSLISAYLTTGVTASYLVVSWYSTFI